LTSDNYMKVPLEKQREGLIRQINRIGSTE